jgi:hypothetical protein
MRRVLRALALLAALAVPRAAVAGGYNNVYLVPALKQCVGTIPCQPREFESSYTFDSIVLQSPASRYMPSGKPSLILKVHGVRDASGTLVNGHLVLKILSGRVSIPAYGTFPDDFGLVQVAPLTVPLKNGSNARFPYMAQGVPSGTIVNGGGVEVYDPSGKLLAVTGSQSRP